MPQLSARPLGAIGAYKINKDKFMKNVSLTILTGILFFLSLYNLKAQGLHTIQSGNYPLEVENNSFHNSLIKKLFCEKINRNKTFLNRQMQSGKKMNGKKSINQSYFPDTAVVYSTTDTIRLIYSYNANGKVIQILSQQLFNEQWRNLDLGTYTYDPNGNELCESVAGWSNGQWTNLWSDTFTYDSNDHELSYLNQYWSDGQLTNNLMSTFTYDVNGNKLTELFQVYNVGQWSNDWQHIYTYDSIGNKQTDLFQSYNGGWTNGSLDTYHYNANGHVLDRLYQQWSNGQWINDSLNTYIYDASEYVLTHLCEQWSNGQWTNYSLDTNTYDTNGYCLSHLYKQSVNGQLADNYLETFEYDTKGNQLSHLYQEWSIGQWTNYSLDTHSYTEDGKELTHLFEQWSNGQWTNNFLISYTYDANGNILTEVSVMWSNSSWIPVDHMFPIGMGYRVSISYKLLYVTDISTNTNFIASNYSLSQNYPNPFNPSTTISFSLLSKSFVTLKIFDLMGREIATLINGEMSSGSHSQKWNASDLSSGIYFYRLQTGSFTETKKLVLLR